MSDLQFEQVANIKVFGIGGGGCNAVNRMVSEGVKGVEFYVANTDLQALNISPVENKIVLGREVTKGWVPGRIRKWEDVLPRKMKMKSGKRLREAIWCLSPQDLAAEPEPVFAPMLRENCTKKGIDGRYRYKAVHL